MGSHRNIATDFLVEAGVRDVLESIVHFKHDSLATPAAEKALGKWHMIQPDIAEWIDVRGPPLAARRCPARFDRRREPGPDQRPGAVRCTGRKKSVLLPVEVHHGADGDFPIVMSGAEIDDWREGARAIGQLQMLCAGEMLETTETVATRVFALRRLDDFGQRS